MARAHSSAAKDPVFRDVVGRHAIDSLNSSMSVPSGVSMDAKSSGAGFPRTAIDIGHDLGGLWFLEQLNRSFTAYERLVVNVIGACRLRYVLHRLRNEEQNPFARIALNDFFVASNGVEDLWTQPHVADRADASRASDRQAVSPFRHQIEMARLWDPWRRRARRVQHAVVRVGLGRTFSPQGFFSASTVSVRSRDRLRFFHASRQVVGLHHQFEDLVFDRLDFPCANAISCWIAWYS
jgi:hypothetical protein